MVLAFKHELLNNCLLKSGLWRHFLLDFWAQKLDVMSVGKQRKSSDLAVALGGSESASTQSLTVYVPSADSEGRPLLDQQKWVRSCATLLAEIGGGVTIMPPVDGGWRRPEDGEIVWEKPILVYTYIRPDSFEQMLPELRNFLHRMGRETRQGEVACLFDGFFYRITEFDEEAHETE